MEQLVAHRRRRRAGALCCWPLCVDAPAAAVVFVVVVVDGLFLLDARDRSVRKSPMPSAALVALLELAEDAADDEAEADADSGDKLKSSSPSESPTLLMMRGRAARTDRRESAHCRRHVRGAGWRGLDERTGRHGDG